MHKKKVVKSIYEQNVVDKMFDISQQVHIERNDILLKKITYSLL